MHAYRDQYAQIFNSGQDVVLIAISTDDIEDLASWAHDDDFQFLMASDRALTAAEAYGAVANRVGPNLTNRNLFVIGPDGRIAHTATPFGEVDPMAYEALEAAIDSLAVAVEGQM
ncbi:MAG: redoxin domain-containing protein [Longimicrobiales bacterium]